MRKNVQSIPDPDEGTQRRVADTPVYTEDDCKKFFLNNYESPIDVVWHLKSLQSSNDFLVKRVKSLTCQVKNLGAGVPGRRVVKKVVKVLEKQPSVEVKKGMKKVAPNKNFKVAVKLLRKRVIKSKPLSALEKFDKEVAIPLAKALKASDIWGKKPITYSAEPPEPLIKLPARSHVKIKKEKKNG